MKRGPGTILTIATMTVMVASCAELFDEPRQCTTDRDCDKFDAICDEGRGVCVARGEGADAGLMDRSVGTSPGSESTTDALPADYCCNVSPKPAGTIGTRADGTTRAEIATSTTLGCDKDWVLDGPVFVQSGATLTIEAGTTIHAKKDTDATIVVSPGGRIVAEGKRDRPIVITSDSPTPAPGDWHGVIVLGLAPPSGQGPYEDIPAFAWGGSNADDDSGVLSFLRIEYARSGLSLVGVGRRTKIDYVQVRRPVKHCFTFYGGRPDVKHLVCQSPGDDQFEWQVGAAGRAQFLFGQKAAPPEVYGSGGILVEDSRPVIYNATICGDKPTNLYGYGVLFRDGATLNLNGAIVTGWYGGLEATAAYRLPDYGSSTFSQSIVFGNAGNPAYVEDPNVTNSNLSTYDDDNGFDEIAFFNDPARGNATTDPQLVDCFDAKSPKPWPTTSLTANAPAPPDNGFFDPNAKYIGAFKDEGDPWMKGAWVRFDDK